MTQLKDNYNEISEVASLLHTNGWAEKNAGNFSIKLNVNINSASSNQYQLNEVFADIANDVFLVTGKGRRMRDIAKSPTANTVIIKISSSGNSYSIVSENDATPTSELPTHLAIHNMIAKRGSSEKAVIHSHVTELIALTHIQEYCNQEKVSNLLWQMHPETIMFIPKGVGFVPTMLPGSAEIASATIMSLQYHQITLWEKHGVFSIADNLNDCYDLIDIAAKSAKIYFMCAAQGIQPQGLTNKQLDQLKEIKF